MLGVAYLNVRKDYFLINKSSLLQKIIYIFKNM